MIECLIEGFIQWLIELLIEWLRHFLHNLVGAGFDVSSRLEVLRFDVIDADTLDWFL